MEKTTEDPFEPFYRHIPFDQDAVFVAGGHALRTWGGYEWLVGDLDVWILQAETTMPHPEVLMAHQFCDNVEADKDLEVEITHTIGNANRVTIHTHKVSLNIEFLDARDKASTPEELLDTFDLDIARVGFYYGLGHSTSTYSFFTSPTFNESAAKKMTPAILTINQAYVDKSYDRIAKYENRGFTVLAHDTEAKRRKMDEKIILYKAPQPMRQCNNWGESYY